MTPRNLYRIPAIDYYGKPYVKTIELTDREAIRLGLMERPITTHTRTEQPVTDGCCEDENSSQAAADFAERVNDYFENKLWEGER